MGSDNKYASVDDVESRYATDFLIRITNFTDEDEGTEINEDRITTALEDASDLIDGYLQGRYAIPVSPFPEFFIPDTVKLAIKLLVERKGYEPKSPDEAHVTAGNEVLKKYMAIADGSISISIPDSGGSSVPPTKVLTSSPGAIFDKETLDKY
jgi:phage gp36-like protein